MNVRTISKLALGLLAALSINAIAQENPWMVRARATHLNWDNSENSQLAAAGLGVNAKNKTIPELDISYFFTKNIAAELVLTYPQRVNVNSTAAGDLGYVRALPPTLLAQYHFTQFGPLKPYVGVGLNYTIFSRRQSLAGGAYGVESSSFSYAAQVGADYMLTKNWGVNLDVKYLRIKTDVVLASGAHAGNLNLSPIATSVGVTYKF
jgi:outer membrane protein